MHIAKIKGIQISSPRDFWNVINGDKKSSKIGDIVLNSFKDYFWELGKDNAARATPIPEYNNVATNEQVNRSFTIEEVKKHITFLKKINPLA